MKSIVIYASRYGNTRRIAEAITEALQTHGEAQLFPADEALPVLPKRIDLQDVNRKVMQVAQRRVPGPKVVHGEPHDPRLAPGSLDLALLVHMYHEVTQPFGLLWNLRPALRPGARVAVIDARKETASHGTPPDLLACELAAVGFRQTAFYDLQENTYLAVFEPAEAPASPAAIRPCSARHS